MERQQQPPVSTRMSMSSSTLSSMLESVSPLSAKNLTSAQGASHVQGSGHSGATHSPPASSSGGSDSSYTSGGVAPVAGAAAATSATNQFADANTSQQALPVTTTIDASSSPSSSSKPKEVFEFTKRKRYADLLTTELTEAIILVLSLNGDVWYCGNAVQDLLGWRDDEVIDRKFSEFINADDRAKFQTMFRESIQQKSELLSYARLQCKQTEPFVITATTSGVGEFTSPPAKEVLFEIKGYPHFLPDTDEFKCFFAVAKPYPSRNTAMLNTYLELKMENDRLHEKLSQLRIRKGSVSSASPSIPPSSSAGPTSTTPTSQYHPHVPQYPQLYPQEPATHGIIPPPLPNGELPANSGFYGGAYEEAMLPGPSNIRFDTSNAYGQGQGSGSAVGEEDNGSGATGTGDPNGPRKKKKVYTAEQYVCVTCGRTDSPEWRKGPTGPKTLCNACGLRWAKRVRTSKGEEAGAGKSAS